MLRNLHFEPGLVASYQKSPRAWWAAAAAAASTILVTLCAAAGAWQEALATSREYEELRSWGMPHDAALREALGLVASARRETAQPLYFAGKA